MNYNEIKKDIEILLNEYKNLFDNKTNNAIKHYIEHDEYEMAFEGLFIDIIKQNNWISDKSITYYLEIGMQLSLDKESVFDPDFWMKLNCWQISIKD